jgi:hypothetical protein
MANAGKDIRLFTSKDVQTWYQPVAGRRIFLGDALARRLPSDSRRTT